MGASVEIIGTAEDLSRQQCPAMDKPFKKKKHAWKSIEMSWRFEVALFKCTCTRQVTRATHVRNRVCPRVSLVNRKQ